MVSVHYWLIVVVASIPATAIVWTASSSSLPSLSLRIASRPPSRQSTPIMHHQVSDNHHGSASSPTKRIVLVGGGHAHVQVIKALNAHSRPPNLNVTLIDLQSSASYSGMVPGCVSKLYTLEQVQIRLDSLAGWAGIEFVCGKVMGMSFDDNDDGGGKKVHVEVYEDKNVVTKEIPFDVISIDIGSTTRDFTSIPGASKYTISTRPISDLVLRIDKEEEILKEKLSTDGVSDGARVVVVGAGAAGIELSLALRARWNNLLESKLSITLIDSNDVLLPSETPACRSSLTKVLEKYKIDVRQNFVVDEVTSSHVHISSNSDKISDMKDQIPYTHCMWATGAEAHELSWNLHKQCGLSLSKRGWIRVNEQLQSISHPSVFAAGDCCEIVNDKGRSTPKAGVYAVRSGPILVENLTRFLGANPHSNELVTYHPQDDFLKLLMCGDGTALGFRFGFPLYGKWVWHLKDHIDRMFMDLFDVKLLRDTEARKGDDNEEDSGNVEYDTSQYDAYEATKERMKADDAGKLLFRTDDDVDFQLAWSVIRSMMADDEYKKEVLSIVHQLPSGKI